MRTILLILPLLFAVEAITLKCRDQENKEVDWFAAYKMPKLHDNSAAGIDNGYAFYYMDANHPQFSPSKIPLSKKNQAVAYTLEQYYKEQNDPELFHIMYNDEEPEVSGERRQQIEQMLYRRRVQYGHLKGVAFFNKNGGVWLVHSVPRFPPAKGYEYPESGTNYGQSMLCMSLSYKQLKDIGTLLYYDHPDMYSSRLPTEIGAQFKDLQLLISGRYHRGQPAFHIAEMKTLKGQTFKAFAKSGDFGKDLYEGLVAPELKTSLDVETWRRGSAVTLECKTKYAVRDVQHIKVLASDAFKYTHDHSKIAVSMNGTTPYVCIGDINRMTSQFHRGGGTVCFEQKSVWTSYVHSVVDVNSCK